MLDKCYRREAKLQRLRAGFQRAFRIAGSPWVPRMSQRDVSAMLTSLWVLQKPLTETLELTQTILAWQEDAVIVEARRPTKVQVDWTCRPRPDPSEQHGRFEPLHLVFSTKRDVCRDEGGLNRIEDSPYCVQTWAPGRRNEERELPSAVWADGHGDGEVV